ncbi:MAG TPA: ATP-binding protein [Gemmatimonadota bacterium]|nr:ATP-binding protein [Gemmatimonadota bacterium]
MAQMKKRGPMGERGARKPADILDRDGEWGSLTSLLQSDRPELAFVLGRRRVGKSFLLARFAREAGGVYYQATKRTELEQLANLTRIVGSHYGDVAIERGAAFPDWEALFGYIAQRSGGDPFLLVLDEFPYLADAAPALPSILQSLWDHAWPGTRAKVILSGSHITAMRRLERADQPLYGRRTGKIEVQPFPYVDAARFFPGYGAADRLLAYGIFGGLPGHLSLIDPALAVHENVSRQLLDSSGRLVDEAQHMLDAFLGEAEVHYSVIEAIANGERTWGRISSRVGRAASSLSRPLRWLSDMRIVTRVVPVTAGRARKSKRAIYRITDPYVAFWHRFVSPLVDSGAVGMVEPERLWEVRVLPGLDGYMGEVFEAACREFVRRTDRLPFEPIRVGEWWDAASRNQVDVVALGPEGEVLVGECKWGTVDAHDLTRLEARAMSLVKELDAVRHVHLCLFSGRRPKDPALVARVERGDVLHFTIDDLYDAP